ncbi:uncharacterized protein LOC141622065 [Silene latifolia]|uniref:uncharacterized protein LOC141622065 n=1 Tax=Silene latifolia TaxID=37657 RepID=UPI003D77AB59
MQLCYFKGLKATPHKLMKMSKKDKKANWISSRASQVHVEYLSLKSQASSAGEKTADEFQLDIQAVGGFYPKMREQKTGSATRELFTPPSNRSQPSVPSCSPRLAAQYALENAWLKEQLSNLMMDREAIRLHLEANCLELKRQSEVMNSMMAFMAEKLGLPLNPTCSSGRRPSPN